MQDEDSETEEGIARKENLKVGKLRIYQDALEMLDQIRNFKLGGSTETKAEEAPAAKEEDPEPSDPNNLNP